MTSRVHNFTGGPSTLPLPVLQRIQEEFLDFQGIGASIVEISHRTPQFEGVRAETEAMIKELMEPPPPLGARTNSLRRFRVLALTSIAILKTISRGQTL